MSAYSNDVNVADCDADLNGHSKQASCGTLPFLTLLIVSGVDVSLRLRRQCGEV